MLRVKYRCRNRVALRYNNRFVVIGGSVSTPRSLFKLTFIQRSMTRDKIGLIIVSKVLFKCLVNFMADFQIMFGKVEERLRFRFNVKFGV